MKHELKPGTRVAVYAGERVVGTVTGFHEGDPNRIWVRPDRGNLGLPPVHPKQCRRLVKREHREWSGKWMRIDNKDGTDFLAFVPDDFEQSIIGTEMTLREVRPRKGGGK